MKQNGPSITLLSKFREVQEGVLSSNIIREMRTLVVLWVCLVRAVHYPIEWVDLDCSLTEKNF